LSDAAWNNMPQILTAATGLLVAVSVYLQRNDARKRDEAEKAAAAKLAVIATQTDGMNKAMIALASKAGEAVGADAQKARHDVQDAAKTEAAQVLLDTTKVASEAKGWDEGVADQRARQAGQ
jgi:hypothetical protein